MQGPASTTETPGPTFDVKAFVMRQERMLEARVARVLLPLIGAKDMACELAPIAFGTNYPLLNLSVQKVLDRTGLAPFTQLCESQGKVGILISEEAYKTPDIRLQMEHELHRAHELLAVEERNPQR